MCVCVCVCVCFFVCDNLQIDLHISVNHQPYIDTGFKFEYLPVPTLSYTNITQIKLNSINVMSVYGSNMDIFPIINANSLKLQTNGTQHWSHLSLINSTHAITTLPIVSKNFPSNLILKSYFCLSKQKFTSILHVFLLQIPHLLLKYLR